VPDAYFNVKMNIYYNLNQSLGRAFSRPFPCKKGVNFKKIALKLSQGTGLFLILAISLKIISLPGLSFSLESVPTSLTATVNSNLNESQPPKLEKAENTEAKATKNFNLLPFSTIKTEKLKGEDEGRVNILVLGMPGGSNPAPYLTDSIIVASLNLQDLKKATLISIPRDLMVRIPDGYIAKINSLYILDKKKLKNLEHLELLEKTIEEITSLKIHYFIVIKLEGLGKLVDAVGGVKIFVDEPIYDSQFPGPNRSYETFIMPGGWQYLDGKTAEKYVRVRHTKGNDYGRMTRQQQIIEAVREKAMNLNLLSDLPTFLEIERILSTYFETNLTREEGARILELAQNFHKDDIVYKVIDPSTGLITSGTVNNLGFVLWPKAGQFDYTKIQQYIQNLIK